MIQRRWCGILSLAANGNDEKGGVRAISAFVHQTGMTLSQSILSAPLQIEYANKVHRPALTTTAILPAISYFLRVNDGNTAVVTPGGGTCGAAGLLIGLIGHTSEPLELAIRQVGHKARTEEAEESQRGEHRLS